MKIHEIILETTSSGCIAGVVGNVGRYGRRGPYFGEPTVKNENNNLLDRPTPTLQDLAAIHKVSIDAIKTQLAKGIEVELEHTSDSAIAKEIALDHIAERPDYYDMLIKAEQSK